MIYAIIGLRNGFIATIIQVASVFVTIILVIWIAPAFTSFIDNMCGGAISNFFSNQMVSVVNGFSIPSEYNIITEEMGETSATFIANASTGLGGVLKQIVLAIVGNQTLSVGTNVTEWFASSLGNFVTILAVAVLLFVLIRLILGIISKIFDRILENHALNAIDKILGIVVGVIKALIIISIILMILKFLTILPFVNNLITSWIEQTSILNWYATWLFNMIDKILANVDFNVLAGSLF